MNSPSVEIQREPIHIDITTSFTEGITSELLKNGTGNIFKMPTFWYPFNGKLQILLQRIEAGLLRITNSVQVLAAALNKNYLYALQFADDQAVLTNDKGRYYLRSIRN